MLDRIDRTILNTLQNDGRLSNKELAACVGLAPSSCLERVRRLRERGVLQRFGAEVDPAALGIGLQALIAVDLVRHERGAVESFQDAVIELDEVIAMHHLSGTNDFLLHVVVRDPDHLRDMVMDGLTTRPEVSKTQTSLLFSSYRSPTLPDLLGE